MFIARKCECKVFVHEIAEFDYAFGYGRIGLRTVKTRRTAFAWAWENRGGFGVSAIGESPEQAECW